MKISNLHSRVLRTALIMENLKADGFEELAVKKVCYFKHSQFIVVGGDGYEF